MALLKSLLLDVLSIIFGAMLGGGRFFSSAMADELQESEESRGDALFILSVFAAFGAFLYGVSVVFSG
jgi:hypothetical protein